jgi:uncharacterized protein (DUF2252 family)
MKFKRHKRVSVDDLLPQGKEPSIESATAGYEAWMRSCTSVISSDLRIKHEQMKESPFQFLRGSFYRWAQLWPSICSDLCDAPRVLAVGDLHVNSFGTWRDAEGRLCWGVDDFDESYPLAYTNDIVRLAASLKSSSMLMASRSNSKTDAVPSWTDIFSLSARVVARSSSPKKNRSLAS